MKPFAVLSLGALISLTAWFQSNSHLSASSHGSTNTPTSAPSVVNPLLPTGPDPWLIVKDGVYYYMNTTGSTLTIWKTRHLGALASAEKKVVWTPPSSGPYSHEIWAPELHFLKGKWYIYFAADAGTNQSHRVWVLENSSPDPMQGKWGMKGKLADPDGRWAIEPTVFENRGRLYAAWSGWEGDINGVQSIYIAELANPWPGKGRRARISSPQYPWEKIGDRDLKRDPEKNPALDVEEPLHIDVN